METSINYWAVLVAAIVSMGIGSLWYGVLFVKPWMRMMGYTEESMKGMRMTPKKAMTLQFIVSLIMAYVLAYFVIVAGAFDSLSVWGAGVATAFWIWLGFIVPITIGIVLWENKPWKLWFINASNYLVTLLIMGAILGSW